MERLQAKRAERQQRATQGNGVPPPIILKPNESRQQCFERHRARCFLRQGDRVVFKKPKRNRIYGVVDHIETDIGKMFWTQGGETPRYIRVAINKVDKATGEILGYDYVWTTESKITFVATKG